MSPGTHPASPRTIALRAIAFGLAGAAALAAVARLYEGLGPQLLAPLDTAVGEVLWREAMRLEAAGETEAAEARYEQALAAEFAGPQNRRDALKRLGVLRWSQGRLEDAVGPLREAIAADPPAHNAFEPLADALYKLDRLDEAAALIAAWEAGAVRRNDGAARAAAQYHAGRIAWKREALDEAIARYTASDALDPGGRAAADLAVIHADRGEPAQALAWAEKYLERGGTGGRAEYMRQLRARLLRQIAPAPAG